jgi:hypothetical protein
MRILTHGFILGLLAALAGCGGANGGGANTAPIVAGGTPVNTQPVTATVTGTVVDRSGLPIAGVTVSAFHHNNNTTVTATTNADGVYTIAGLQSGDHSDYAFYAGKAEFGFAPAVSDPAGTVTRFDFNGLYRTVIRFTTLPGKTVQGVNFTALRYGDKLASLPRTGAATSYAPGDDAASAKGVAWPGARFTDNGNGTVTDRLTGLVWLRNAGCFAASSWSAALDQASKLASGACGLSDGSSAGQWRMPNVNELESLVDVSRSAPALPAGAQFSNVATSAAYWSSTTYMAGTASAMAIRFTDGRWINGDPGDGDYKNVKTASNMLWAVRSGSAPGAIQLLSTGVFNAPGGGSFGPNDDGLLQLGVKMPFARFVDKGDGTVADTLTGLIWMKKADCINKDWADSLKAVNQLASGQCGLSDGSTSGQWRMPNRAELLSLSDRAPTFPQASYYNGQYQASSTQTGPAIFSNFIVSDYYWTSSTDAADPLQAWAAYSCDFGAYNLAKNSVHFALAVR